MQYSQLTKAVGGGGARWRLGRAIDVIFDMADLQGRQQTVSGLQVGGAATFVGGAVKFVGKGSSAIERSFKAARAELYCCQAGCGGSYELSYYRSLALVKGEGKASEAYAGGACADGAYVGGACVNGDCADKAYVDGACIYRVYTDRAYAGGRSFKTARARARVVDNVKGVNKRDLRRQLMAYELKGPSLSIYSLISASNYSVQLSS